VDSLTRGKTSRHNYSAEASAQFCLGRRRWENALPLREEWTLSDATQHRRREAVVVAAGVERGRSEIRDAYGRTDQLQFYFGASEATSFREGYSVVGW